MRNQRHEGSPGTLIIDPPDSFQIRDVAVRREGLEMSGEVSRVRPVNDFREKKK